MRLVIRPEAERELLEAQAWYELQSPGLGFEFARNADAAIANILRNPYAFQQIEGEFRRAMVRRFPYRVIFLASASEILVVSCFHHRREPVSWSEREKSR